MHPSEKMESRDASQTARPTMSERLLQAANVRNAHWNSIPGLFWDPGKIRRDLRAPDLPQAGRPTLLFGSVPPPRRPRVHRKGYAARDRWRVSA
jgi:hypothetical protein